MVDFPHLTGNTPNYPIAPSNMPQVYQQYKNTFDYTQWSADTIIRLCNVPWDGMRDNMCFPDDETRDTWFEGVESYSMRLETPCRMIRGIIKVPIPYDVVSCYNYVWLTLGNAPIEYEEDKSVKHWGFFIENLEYRSPSTTELTLSVDWWTTFINHIEVKSVVLQQGHWAVRNSANVADYLASPMTHTSNLMDNEGDNIGTSILRRQLSHDINSGAQWAIIDFGGANPISSANHDEIAFKSPFTRVSSIPSGYLVAIEPSNLATLIGALSEGIRESLKAIYFVAKKFVNVSTTAITLVGNVTGYEVQNAVDVSLNVNLTKNMFAYSDKYNELTKLYTSQYAHVIVIGSNGQRIEVKPEECGTNTSFNARIAFANQGAQALAWLNGIGANGETYTIQQLTSNTFPIGGRWSETLMSFNIPCFAIYSSAEYAANWHKHYTRLQTQEEIATTYANAQRSATTVQNNTNASADTAKANNTRNTNNNVTNNTLNVEYQKSMELVNNAYATEVTRDNCNIQGQKLGVTLTNSELLGNGTGTYDSSLVGSALNQLSQNAQLDWEYNSAQYQQAIAQITNPTMFAYNAVNGVASQVGNVAQTAINKGQDATAMTAVTGAVGAAANLIGAAVNLNTTISNNEALHDIARTYQVGDGVAYYFGGKTGVAKDNMLYQNQMERKLSHELTTESIAKTRALTDAEIAYQDIDVAHGGALGVSKTTAANNKNTSDTNATATQTTSKTNATRTYNTSIANAQAVRDTATHGYERGISTDNRNAVITHAINVNVVESQKPINATLYVETPCEGDVARIGDRMLKYGYICNRTIKAPKLDIMDKWTYWKCREAWVIGNGKAPQQATNYIKNALINGTTVWHNPSQIGDTEQ